MAESDIIRDAGFGRRLEQAMDAVFGCPTGRGRAAWLMDAYEKKFGQALQFESVRKWRNGITKPRVETSNNLADLLGVDHAWLHLGNDPTITVRDRRVRNAEADGAVNVIAGLIAMDGGFPAFPQPGDTRAIEEHVDLTAIIRGASYNLHIVTALERDGTLQFAVPTQHDRVLVLGVARKGFAFQVIEITQEMIQGGAMRGGTINVTLTEEQMVEGALNDFRSRL